MKSKIYILEGYGNYSYTFNWDSGISFGMPKEWNQEDIEAWDEYIYKNPSMGNYYPDEGKENGVIKLLHAH